MGLSWEQYNLLYYLVQWSLSVIIFFFLVIFIPYDLVDWIIQTVFFLDPINDETNEGNTDTNTKDTPDWCVCDKIWNWFEKFFKRERCTCFQCCKDTDWKTNCLGKCPSGLSDCVCGSDDLKNKKLPHRHKIKVIKVGKKDRQWYCGFIKINPNRIGVYVLLCASALCASLAFFEGIILGYASVNQGDNCPIPKQGTPATIVDCFIFAHQWDHSPINVTFPTQCNGTVELSFSGFRAGCFAWIYKEVEVVGVIEELGICAGIIALFGTFVIILCYLCRKHRWRFLFDVLAYLAVPTFLVLIWQDGNVSFITYVLLGSFGGIIIVIEYLLNYVPLLTGLCLAHGSYKRIKNCLKPRMQTTVTPSVQDSHC